MRSRVYPPSPTHMHTEHRDPYPAGRGGQHGQPVPSSYLPTLGPSFHPQLRLKAAGALISHPKPPSLTPMDSPQAQPTFLTPVTPQSVLYPWVYPLAEARGQGVRRAGAADFELRSQVLSPRSPIC